MTTCSEGEVASADDAISACVNVTAKTYKYELFEDVHDAIAPPTDDGRTICSRGGFRYFHYGCDGFADAGWGCGYRTLQTAISWIINKRSTDATYPVQYVPSIEEIQKILVSIGDKSKSFVGSRDWIGTLEEFYVIDVLFRLPCKIIHTKNISPAEVGEQVMRYFEEYAGFIAMGGISDTASKAIVGIQESKEGFYLLVVDPHFVGVPLSKQQLVDQGFIRWMHINEFGFSTYNLCLILQH